MKFSIRSTLAILILGVVGTTSHAIPILKDTGYFGGHRYDLYSDDGVDWATAQAYALSIGGYLATATSATEDNFIDAMLAASDTNKGGFANSELWIGGIQPPGSAEPNGGWEWVNGEGAFVFTDWLNGEPNNVGNNEHHLAIGLNGMPGWNDEGNLDGIYGFVVERVPEPGTISLLGLGLLGLGLMRRTRAQ